jgi:hypothetical protein
MMSERSPGVSITAEVRPARPNDIEALVVMCGEHARYEGAPYRRAGKAKALSQALFGTAPRLHGWVADAAGELAGYATAAWEFSTWQGGDIEAVMQAGRTTDGTGLMINSSRGIIYAGNDKDFALAARNAAIELRDSINRCR